MRKKVAGMVVALSMLLCSQAVPVTAASNVTVNVNGATLGGAAPVIINNRTMVPLRGIFERLNWHVAWDDWTKTATVKAGVLKADLKLDSPNAVVCGDPVPLDVPVTIVNGSVMVPISFFSNVGTEVKWNDRTRTVSITAEPITWDVETVNFDNGDTYVGEMFDGEPDGKGTYTFANGSKYIGQFAEGEIDGQGRMEYSNGDVYEGSWWLGATHGKGIKRMSNGAVYEGEWKGGQMSGKGTLTYASGDQYVGMFLNDNMNGQGVMTLNEGGTYVGNFKSGKYDGYGVRSYTDGTKYEGMWSMGAKVN